MTNDGLSAEDFDAVRIAFRVFSDAFRRFLEGTEDDFGPMTLRAMRESHVLMAGALRLITRAQCDQEMAKLRAETN